MKRQLLATAACAVALVAGAAAQTIKINGAGATFPNPIYSKWFSEYNKLHSNIEINYQPIGSGGGIRQITNQTVFFGATDGPMTNDQLLAAPGKILHIPTVLGAVVPVYNIPNVTAELKFSGPVPRHLPRQGHQVERSRDRKANAGVTCRRRYHGCTPTSGTSYIWVDYLAKVSGVEDQGRRGDFMNWPTGVGKGNEGVAGLVTQTPGSIGYVELIYALQNKISYGSVQNLAGEFLRASVESVTASASAAAAKMPADFRVSITNAEGKGVYPISSFTWLLLYESPKDKNQAKTMVEFTKWALTDGQKFCAELGYAPLPEAVVKLEMAAIAKIKVS
jgi:phosphate transport system substrate-binding protein